MRRRILIYERTEIVRKAYATRAYGNERKEMS